MSQKKIKTQQAILAETACGPHWAKMRTPAARLESGFKLSARMQNARKKFAAQSAAAVQPGPVAPKKCRAMPLIADRKITQPNAMPMSPIRLDRFSGG